MRRPTIFACLVLALAMLTPMTVASGAPGNAGFKTSRPSMLTPVMAGVEVDPLLTVGDVLPGGYRFEAIPDGISLRTRGQGRVDVYVNHETSKAPFPFVTAGPTVSNSENDFDNSQVSRLVLNKTTGGVLNGSFAIPSSAGFHRFCSNFLATAEHGFDTDLLLTNEEAIDYVFRQEDSWPPPIGDPDEKQAGLAVALDVQTGQFVSIPGMGRHNHENSVAIPGFDELVVLSGDDTFTSGPLTIPPGGPVTDTSSAAQSQLFSYIAEDTDSLLADEGDLWAFVSDDEDFDDYYDFVPGSTEDITGQFVQVPKDVATGLDTDGSELKAADEGFPLPPTNGSWQRDIRTTVPTGLDGPQWVLEYWSQANDVFDFVRVEDIAYDKRPGQENVVYIIDSGRGQALTPAPGVSTNGRIWRMELDPNDPTKVLSMRVFLEGDDSPVKTPTEIRQPDNLESTQTGLIVTEDPGSAQQFPVGSTDPNATTGRLMFAPFVGDNAGTPDVVAMVDQSEDGEETDVDDRADGNLGAWESSGIVDASQAFGPGWFLVDVQAHTLWVEKEPGFDTFIDANTDPDFMFKREGGQLLLIYIPAAIPD
ncbi:MAG TPA: hypothetical protein VJ913_06230 [Actinomycetota bacterium]|nr:hypothetical protein [Actinomycetota bacterium]